MSQNIVIPDNTNTAPDIKRQARSLYWKGWGVSYIADELRLPSSTIRSWKNRDEWDKAPMIERLENTLECRLMNLIDKDPKTGQDFKEIDLLHRQVAHLAKVRYYENTGKAGILSDKPRSRNKLEKRNFFTKEQFEQLKANFEDMIFDYQKVWQVNRDQRLRMILKSRQIGATFYFAYEALIDAIETGRNQIFLSASKNQAFQFRTYMIQFAQRVGVELTGDPMLISSEFHPDEKVELHFLGTNYRTAQGRHGNLYFDEFFWTFNFPELEKVASGMAMQKRFRKTYFSTPSTLDHPAYPYWTGDIYNRKRKKSDQVEIDISHEALKDGLLCADKKWRNIVTIYDAEKGGCDLFDLDELKEEYAPDAFANLLECQFVDDSLSAFKFHDIQRAFVDALIDWEDFNPESSAPYGNKPVWAGYDPQESQEGDNAALVIVAPPIEIGGKFRLLERHQLRGLDFQQQATFILRTLERYNCTYLGIDATGIGSAVYQLLSGKIKGLSRIEYSLDVKARMVMKAQNVFRNNRIEIDAGCIDIASSFISIKKTLTQSGTNVTYKSDRSRETGHADLAWAMMHVLINEPLDGKPKPKARIKFL